MLTLLLAVLLLLLLLLLLPLALEAAAPLASRLSDIIAPTAPTVASDEAVSEPKDAGRLADRVPMLPTSTRLKPPVIGPTAPWLSRPDATADAAADAAETATRATAAAATD
tara:strand:- start:293 stop:625 length:333 start_codon:yes stop_codon:yes gene_type:complete